MRPHMSAGEVALLCQEISGAESYLEWGAGGSTLTAMERVHGLIMSVESDPAFVETLSQDNAVKEAIATGRLILHHAAIGPVGPWGFPIEPVERHRWKDYVMAPWCRNGFQPSRVLVDGRFRVACVASALLHGPFNARIMLHDYADGNPRRRYEILETVARLERLVGTLAVFVRREDVAEDRLNTLLNTAIADPA